MDDDTSTLPVVVQRSRSYEIDGELFLDPGKIALEYMTTPEELVATAGLHEVDSVMYLDDDVQRCLQQITEIVDEMSKTLPNTTVAYAWYRSVPLSGFDGLTAADLVAEGRADYVTSYLERVRQGGFA